MRTLKQAAHRHRSSRSSILIHIFCSCLFSSLSLFSIPPSVSVLQAAKMLALPPPFVLQWERECTADALLSAAQPASEQCIGLMQCSCVLTHSTSPPPVCLLLPPLTVSIFSSLLISLSLPLCFLHVLSLAFFPYFHSPDHFTCDFPLSIALSPQQLPQPIVKIESLPFQCIMQRYKVRLSTPALEWFAFSVSLCLVSVAVRQCF